MAKGGRKVAWLVAATLSSLASLPTMADPGSESFDRYLLDLRQRMQAVDSGSYWVSTQVDQGAFERYLAVLGQSAGGPTMTDTAVVVASLNAQPLRSFNAYLAYLGQRMRVDAGPPGPLLKTDNGTAPFDRYIEEINYRIQSQYQADAVMGF
ncbi:MAG: hypothetical protein HYZ20_15055 [Burkholderiales bacterium]|nr:hypothetical protein [Burkholderiales bacterium]